MKYLKIIEHHFVQKVLYNSTTRKIKKYYKTDFIYPKIAYGQSNPNESYYGILIQKCINSSYNNNSCDSLEKINDELDEIGIDLCIINNDVDIEI